ncbi:unnamed protein product [Adineta ricciae]|uniref:Uncharacterized protein n=1 Tax=Adineta ricciae TaxID=249248 RepID=A0A816DF92_ADIRI|nr:unnamed protein product [Adineta ricciae]
MEPMNNSIIVKGFYIGCYPVEAILQSTLDCLYDIDCLQLLTNYFPKLQHINFNPNNSVLLTKHRNISVNEYFNEFFIFNWSKEINHEKYFNQCLPFNCTYFIKHAMKLSYGITLFISLYGGLIIILRFISSFMIESFIHLQVTIVVLCLFTSLKSEIVTIIERNPSFERYKSLEISYSSNLRCSCSNETISYKNFLSLSPHFHPICSSSFISSEWILNMRDNDRGRISDDWIYYSSSLFQYLSDFCKLSNKTIDESMNRYLSQLFFISSLINENDFQKQFNTSLNQFYRSTLSNFALIINVINLHLKVDQYYTGSHARIVHNLNINLFGNVSMNSIKLAQFKFHLNGIAELNSTKVQCNCVENPSCQIPAAIYYSGSAFLPGNNKKNLFYQISGWIQGCLIIDSLFLSTLECLYENSDCFPLLLSFIEKKRKSLNNQSDVFQPLVYNPQTDFFSPQTKISELFVKMLVDRWNSLISYKLFYDSCSPSLCTYSKEIPKENILGIIIKLISTIGGIVGALKIFTPYLVKFIVRLSKICNIKQEPKEPAQRSTMKMEIKDLIRTIRKILIELNLFSFRDFGSDLDRIKAKNYGQWATRLYLLLYLLSFSILIFYTLIQPNVVIEAFPKPSLDLYKNLKNRHGNQLKCSCSKIASSNNEFIEINSRFHSICSNEFITKKWQIDLSSYSLKDYRRYLLSHFQYLRGLCEISQELINNWKNELSTSLLITIELLSKEDFSNYFQNLIDRNKLFSSIKFSRYLNLIQIINHGNSLITTFGTNYQFISLILNEKQQNYAFTKEEIYDKNCSCGIDPSCTSDAMFIEKNLSIPIQGLKIGCLPSESFHLSTLECFYNQSCLDLLSKWTNSTNSLKPLSIESTRFSLNTTINEFIENFFVEQLSIEMNYSLYYHQCFPLLCSIKFIEKFHVFYLITLFIGLEGGLTIGLKWLSPKLIRFLLQLKRKQATQIHTENSLNLIRISSSRHCSKMIFPICFLLFLIGILILFSFYYSQHISQSTRTTTKHFISTTSLLPSTSSVTSSELFSEMIEEHLKSQGCFSSNLTSLNRIYVGDFNNDNQSDLIISHYIQRNPHLTVLLANRNGTFQDQNLLSMKINETLREMKIIDVNNDQILDLIIIVQREKNIYVLLGNGNGRFALDLILFVRANSDLKGLDVIHLNDDNYLDIIVNDQSSSHFLIFYGKSNGTFHNLPKWIFTRVDGEMSTVITGDFNNDFRLDVAFVYELNGFNYLIYQNNNQSFDIKDKNMITSVQYFNLVLVDDINNDNYLDLIVDFLLPYEIYILFGDGKGKFIEEKFYSSEFRDMNGWININDFNYDHYQDIISINKGASLINPFRTGGHYSGH